MYVYSLFLQNEYIEAYELIYRWNLLDSTDKIIVKVKMSYYAFNDDYYEAIRLCEEWIEPIINNKNFIHAKKTCEVLALCYSILSDCIKLQKENRTILSDDLLIKSLKIFRNVSSIFTETVAGDEQLKKNLNYFLNLLSHFQLDWTTELEKELGEFFCDFQTLLRKEGWFTKRINDYGINKIA